MPLGILESQSYPQTTIALEPGDLLLLYTDGITEARAPATAPGVPREMFGVERLDELLLSCDADDPAACVARVCDAVATFTQHAPPNDDRTLIAMRCVE